MSGQNGELDQSVQYFDLHIYTGIQNIMQIMFSVSCFLLQMHNTNHQLLTGQIIWRNFVNISYAIISIKCWRLWMRTAVFLDKPSLHIDAGWVWYLAYIWSYLNNVYLASLSCDLGLGHWHWLEILQDSLLEDLEEFWPLVIKRKVWSNIVWVSTFLDSLLKFFCFYIWGASSGTSHQQQ